MCVELHWLYCLHMPMNRKQEKNISFTSSIALIFKHFTTLKAAAKTQNRANEATLCFNVPTKLIVRHTTDGRAVHIPYIAGLHS